MNRICRFCEAGHHRRCVDNQTPDGPNQCECANGTHENHYDDQDQLILVGEDQP